MAGGLFSRIKNWVMGDNFTSADVNNEFNNIINNFSPDKMSGYSNTVSQMQSTFNPGAVGSENQPASQAQEDQALRFLIQEITGGAQWYSPPPVTLTSLSPSIPPFRIISGRVSTYLQPMYLVPNGSSNGFTLKATTTNLVTYLTSQQVTFSADITASGLTTAPSSNNTCLVNDSTLSGAQATKLQGEGNTQINIDTIGTAISNLTGTIQAFKIVDSTNTEYFVAEIDTVNNRLLHAYRGFFFNSSDASIARVVVNDNDTITLMKITYVFATYNSTTYAVDTTYNPPVIASSTPSAPAAGDYWYDLVNTVWKKYNGSSYAVTNAVPVGICIQDTTNTVAARSADFYKSFSIQNDINLFTSSQNNVRASFPGQKVNVYGNLLDFQRTIPVWNATASLDTGESNSASTTYYTYVTSQGTQYLSTIAPHDRTMDLLGYYHPAKPYRCVGTIATESASNWGTVVTTTYSGTSGNYSGTVASGTGIIIGMIISATGLPTGTWVTNVSGTTITFSAALTSSPSSTAITFTDPVSYSSYPYNPNVHRPSNTILAASNTTQVISSQTPTAVSSQSVTITTGASGLRPVKISVVADGNIATESQIIVNGNGGGGSAALLLYRDGVAIAFLGLPQVGTSANVFMTPPGEIFQDFNATPGSHTYALYVQAQNSTTQVTVKYITLIASEV